jgi:pilus assembly protein CpaC
MAKLTRHRRLMQAFVTTFARVATLAATVSLSCACLRAQTSTPVAAVPPEGPPAASEPFGPPPGTTTQLHLLVGRSLVLSSPARIRRVSIVDPIIADVMVLSANQVLVNAKSPGGVSLVLWDENEQSHAYELNVDLDLGSLSEQVHAAFPQDQVQLQASKDTLILSGHVSSKEEADRIYQLVSPVEPKTLNLLEFPARPAKSQILLEVRFAEVDRGAMTNLGFNLISVPGSTTRTLAVTGTQQYGPVQIQQSSGTSSSGSSTDSSAGLNSASLSLSDLLNIFIFRPDIDLGAVIKALQQKSLLQILAEPNLLTESGKEADFLAGGEFPFPVIQEGAAGTAPTVTIQFKQFGVSLKFTPDLTDDGTIHLKVKPEVSALDYTNAVTISGFFIPAISTRRVDAEVELRDGQSFAIAGLVDNRVTDIYNKVPVLSSIPLLGDLFKSQSKDRTKTELLVLVTPHVVMPLPVGAPLPTLKFPSGFLDSIPPKPGEKPSPK